MDVTENVEDYLEALFFSEEEGNRLAKIGWIAGHLGVSPPSVVEMLKKLERSGLVVYEARRGVRLSERGRDIAVRIIRNHRLIEVLMKNALGISINEDQVHGIEHHMDEEFSNALCTLLGHPRTCPHGKTIPKGTCCE